MRATAGRAASELRSAILRSIERVGGDADEVERIRVENERQGESNFVGLSFGDRMKEAGYRTFVFIVGPRGGGDTTSRAIYLRNEYVADAVKEKLERDLRIEGAFKVKP